MLLAINVLRAFTEKVEPPSTHQGKGDVLMLWWHGGIHPINSVAVHIHSFIYLTCKFKVTFKISEEEHEDASLTDI